MAEKVEHLQLTPSMGRTRQSGSMTGFQLCREQPPEMAGLRQTCYCSLQGTSEDQKATFCAAVNALRERLEPGGWLLAVQDFRHAAQKGEESVADFICQLERCFRVAYGHDKLGQEAREALLHGQLQESFMMELMRSPSISGAQSYSGLCLAAKNEERRLAELKKRQRYRYIAEMSQGTHPTQRKPSHQPSSGGEQPETYPLAHGPVAEEVPHLWEYKAPPEGL